MSNNRNLTSVIAEALGMRADAAAAQSGVGSGEPTTSRSARSFSVEAFDRAFEVVTAGTAHMTTAESDPNGSLAAFDAAFRPRGGSTAAGERLFGLTPDVDASLELQLREAGFTATGARAVVRDVMERQISTSQAVSFSLAFDGIEPGRVSSLVEARALEILERHTRSEGTACPQMTGGSSAVREARQRVIQAHEAVSGYRDVDVSRRMAEVYADSAVRSLTEWGVRDGWSEDQLVSRLEERATQLRAGGVSSIAGSSDGGRRLGEQRRAREARGHR